LLSKGRGLQLDDEEIPILDVNLIAGSESNTAYLNYTWSLFAISEKELSINVNFTNATAVSSNPVSDYQ